jgi:hypothetical protein
VEDGGSTMIREMFKIALKLMGKAVFVYHKDGNVYHGKLHSVTKKGIYILPYQHAPHLISSNQSGAFALCDPHEAGTERSEHVFAPALFFTFGALTGLAAARPPYPYYGGYPGYGYPGYGSPGYWW